MTRRATPEQTIHMQVAQYLDAALDPDACWYSTVPSGGGGLIRGALLKACGLKVGIPDIVLIPRGRCACFIELKAAGGQVRPAQRALHARLRDLGCLVAVCRSVDEVEGTLKAWMVPTRGRIAA